MHSLYLQKYKKKIIFYKKTKKTKKIKYILNEKHKMLLKLNILLMKNI